ncbi:WYL domain-containing protein [Bradyrhizobium sp. SZCCHNRI30512]|uniref:WYL domain-containing protein n=1 Tax=unclassified Bradyrhizobium TaxID=2631580 RepID=UPI003967190B
MADNTAPLSWGVERRLEFIEFRLFWEGGVNRSDIIEMFDVSVPQASKDLTLYQDRAPHNALYDKSAKRYVASPQFSPIFLRPDPDNYLSRLRAIAEGLTEPGQSWIASLPQMDIALTPRRDVNVMVLKSVIGAIRDRRSIEVYYQSMNPERADAMWRRITPHAFGYDGLRWHARAFCHLTETYKDFLLPRMMDARSLGDPKGIDSGDDLWNDTFSVEIGPHPALTAGQQAVVAKDYGMTDGRVIFKVRYAMLFYVFKRLGLLGDAAKSSPRTQHIVVLNREAAEAALIRADLQL